MGNTTLKSKTIPIDVIRMVYRVIQEKKIGNTLIFLCDEEDKIQSYKLVVLINEYTGKVLELHNVPQRGWRKSLRKHPQYGCAVYNNSFYILCDNDLNIVDLEKLEIIRSFKNVYHVLELDREETDECYARVELVFRSGSEHVRYNATEQKENFIKWKIDNEKTRQQYYDWSKKHKEHWKRVGNVEVFVP